MKRVLNFYLFCFITGLVLIPSKISAQKVDVISSTPLSFGKFFKTNGGNITIDPVTGPDSNPTGDIIIVNEGYRGTVVVSTSNLNKFDGKIVKVAIIPSSNVTLNTILPLIVDVYPTSFEFDQNSIDPKQTIYLGGTLQVGDGTLHPVDIYNGEFTVEFNVVQK